MSQREVPPSQYIVWIRQPPPPGNYCTLVFLTVSVAALFWLRPNTDGTMVESGKYLCPLEFLLLFESKHLFWKMNSSVWTEPLVRTTFCRALCSPLGLINLIRAVQALVPCYCFCKRFIGPPAPRKVCFLSLPDICSIISSWSRPGSGRPSTHSCHGLDQAPTASLNDCSVFFFCPSTPLCAWTSFNSVTVRSVFLKAAVAHCCGMWHMGQGSKNDTEK